MEPTEDINAVQMVREIRDRLYEETKDLSTAELIAFYRRRAALVKRPTKGPPQPGGGESSAQVA